MLYIIHAVGAKRCASRMATCSDGCMPSGSFDGVPPENHPNSRSRTTYDDFLESAIIGPLLSNQQTGNPPPLG